MATSGSVNPVRNSSGALNPVSIILTSNPAGEQRGIISNGVKENGGDKDGQKNSCSLGNA